MNLKDWRQEYNKYKLDESSLTENPLDLFKKWFDQAILDKNYEPNAMTLTTCIDNIPSARVVLLKEVLDGKFIFYTNYNSKKGKEMAQNPNVSLLFFWSNSQRQIRISGTVSKINRAQSVEYFSSRPIDSQVAAIASPQSQEIEIDALFKKVENIIQSQKIECPEHWGGYEVLPYEIEFWQGQPARLHDRILYTLQNALWTTQRLAP